MENHRREINQTGQKKKRRDGKISHKDKEKDTMKWKKIAFLMTMRFLTREYKRNCKEMKSCRVKKYSNYNKKSQRIQKHVWGGIRKKKLKQGINRNGTILRTERKEWGMNRDLKPTIKNTNWCANQGPRGRWERKRNRLFLKK